MFDIDINGKKTKCEINFGTALDYELEFGKDMVADINGSVGNGKASFVTLDESGTSVVGIDFTAVPWTTMLKALWCSAKTVDPKIKPFKKWAQDTKGIDMIDARVKLTEEMEDCFFRNSFVEKGEKD